MQSLTNVAGRKPTLSLRAWIVPAVSFVAVWALMGLLPGLAALAASTLIVAASTAPSGHVVRVSTMALCLGLAACPSNPEGEARAAAEAWLDALNAGNLTAAQELSTEATKGLLQMASTMGESMAVGDYEIVEVKLTSDTAATVTVDAENEEENMVLNLGKIDGEWKVGFQK